MTEALLRPPTLLVSRRAIFYWTIRALPVWVVLCGVQVMWLLGNDPSYRTVRVAVLSATVALAAIHLIVMPQWRYRVHLWETTDEAVYMRSGWLNQESRIAPVSRIQTVDRVTR